MVLISSTILKSQEYTKVNFTSLEWKSLKTESLEINDSSHIVCGLVCADKDECSGVLFDEETGFCDIARVRIYQSINQWIRI